jgi:GNAT superfamily N-acetyltransferase
MIIMKKNNIKILKFDSELFQLKVAQWNVNQNINKIKKQLHEKKIDLLYLNSDDPLSAKSIKDAIGYSAQYIDEKVTFKKTIHHSFAQEKNSNIKTNRWEGKHTQQLEKLALASGEFSRFFQDSFISKNQAKKLYLIWLKKSLSLEIADEFYIYLSPTPLGLLTVKYINNLALVGLLAVDSASRGQGIAKKLLLHLQKRCLTKKIYNIEIPTQRINTTACSFYLNSGYTEAHSSFIYHCRKQNG